MNLNLKSSLALSLALGLVGCGEAPSTPDELEVDSSKSAGVNRAPAWMSAEERAALGTLRQEITSAPANPVLAKPEWAPLEAVLLRWPSGWSELKPMYRDIVSAVQKSTRVYIALTTIAQRDEALDDLDACPSCTYDNVYFVGTSANGIWMRDYGPEFINAGTTQRQAVVDLNYYPGRSKDDAFPPTMAKAVGQTYYAPGIYFEGGNFQSDGAGNCFISWGAVEVNGEQKMRTALKNFFGCKTTHIVPYLKEEGTHHIDMWMKVVSPTTVIVGDHTYFGNEVLQYPDDQNDVILDQVAAQVANLGYQVVRIPQPKSLLGWGGFTIRTHTNSTFTNGGILVPVYGEPSDVAAASVYKSVLPAGTQVHPIDSNVVIEYGGAAHCITMEKFVP